MDNERLQKLLRKRKPAPEDVDLAYSESLARDYAIEAGATCDAVPSEDLTKLLDRVDRLAANGRLPPQFSIALTRAENRFMTLKTKSLEADMALEKMRWCVSVLEKHLVALYAPPGMKLFDYWRQTPGTIRETYEKLRRWQRLVKANKTVLWFVHEKFHLTIDGFVSDPSGFVADAMIFNEKLAQVDRLPDGLAGIDTDLSTYPVPTVGKKLVVQGFMLRTLYDDIVRAAALQEDRVLREGRP